MQTQNLDMVILKEQAVCSVLLLTKHCVSKLRFKIQTVLKKQKNTTLSIQALEIKSLCISLIYNGITNLFLSPFLKCCCS